MMQLALFPSWLHELQISTSTKGFPDGLRLSRIHLQCGRPGFDPWIGKIPWRREWYPLQYSCPENPMDRGPWWATVHGVTESRTSLSN